MDTPRLLGTIETSCPFCDSVTRQVMAQCEHELLAWCQRCFRPRVVASEEPEDFG